jgi:uncharacterized protein (DUF2252 family)
MTAPSSHLTPAQRAQAGKGVRQRLPLAVHADWRPDPGTRDPVAILAAQDAERDPALVPIRHARMAASPFAFYRGGAAIMATDLATQPHSGLTAQLCGDAHAVNFGLYASPERRLLFDVNDFDETLPGPFEWDVKRLAASIAIIAQGNRFSPGDVTATVGSTVTAYREAMHRFAGQPTLDVWYAAMSQQDLQAAARNVRAQVLADDVKARRRRKAGKRGSDHGSDLSPKQAAKLAEATERLMRRSIHEARTSTNLTALAHLTQVVSGRRRIVASPPVVVPLRTLKAQDPAAATAIHEAVRGRLASYAASLPPDRQLLLSRYQIVDVARKVVGVGSVGTLDFVVLLQGRDVGDALLLQVKQAVRSVLADHLGWDQDVQPGERVVRGQRLMQSASDLFLGWSEVEPTGESFYWRQLRDMKGSPPVELMSPESLALHGRLCGTTLAIAHARSSDPVAIAGYLGSGTRFDTAITAFAIRYAQQNALDFAAFGKAIAAGLVTTQPPAAPAGQRADRA